ncbi:MAG TPA: hypothetical protein VK773_00025 [Acidimicrobiales bacterium]|jgi:hypothetical protein|nr:hypothetical protein [Acidimicrobiales bacterium]
MPAAVVNHLHFREPQSPELFAGAEREVVPRARKIEGFRGLDVVQVAPDHFILIITGDTPEVLDRLATEIGSSWMTTHVVPLLASPPERHVGTVVATSGS